jgi:hypothetical protein
LQCLQTAKKTKKVKVTYNISQLLLRVQRWPDRIHRRQQVEQIYLVMQFKLENHRWQRQAHRTIKHRRKSYLNRDVEFLLANRKNIKEKQQMLHHISGMNVRVHPSAGGAFV